MATENDLDLELDDIDMDLDDISGFHDNSTADPEGVWVKSGPEDVPPSAQTNGENPIPTPSPDDNDETNIFGEEDSLSAEELAKLGDSFDIVEASEEPLEGETLDEEGFITPAIPENNNQPKVSALDMADSDGEDLDLAEMELDDMDAVDLDTVPLDSSPSGDALDSSGEDFDEISLDDFVSFDDEVDPSGGIKDPSASQETPPPLSSEEETQEEFLDIDIDIEDEVPDSELEIYEDEKKNAVDEVSLDEFLGEEVDGAEEVDISDFGDFEVEDISDEEMGFNPEKGPEDEASKEQTEPQSPGSMGDLDSPLPPPDDDSPFTSPEEFAGSPETDESQAELDTDGLDDFGDLSLDDEEVEVELGDEDFSEDSIENEELVETDDYFEDIPIDESSDEDFSKDFEDTLSMEKEPSVDFSGDFGEENGEFQEVITTSEPDEADMDNITALEEDLTKGIKQPSSASGADSILQKIESELFSIKAELGDLKKEITGLRNIDGSTKPPLGEGGQGFFSDDEDETIALTGEELDNILTSADIKEDAEILDSDLITTDDDGKIVDDIPQSDQELFEGTDLQPSLDEEVELPDTSGSHPIPGGDGYSEADLNLENNLQETPHDPLKNIPEEIELVDTEDSPADSVGQAVETEDLLGDSPDEDSAGDGFDITDNTLPDMEDVDNLTMAEEEISSDEINFEESESSINLDSDFESIDLDQMEEEQVSEEEESLEIPFDEELSLDEENMDAPSLETVQPPESAPDESDESVAVDSIQEASLEEKAADAKAAQEAFPEPTLGEGARPKATPANQGTGNKVPEALRKEIANVLKYMDNLLDALPDEKIQEFAESEHFEVYKKLFEDLGLME
jgi:pilus assembly protein FimV